MLFGRRSRTLGDSFRDDELRANPGSQRYDPHRRLAWSERRCTDCGYIAAEGTDAMAAHDAICRLPAPPRTRRRPPRRRLARLAAMIARPFLSERRAGRRQADSFS